MLPYSWTILSLSSALQLGLDPGGRRRTLTTQPSCREPDHVVMLRITMIF